MFSKIRLYFNTKPRNSRNLIQRLGFGAVSGISLLTVLPIFLLLGVIIVRGSSAISFNFIFGYPSEGMKAGGIWPAIVGTIYLTLGSAFFSVPLGIGAAIYLSEYAPDNRLTQIIRIAIITLAGIPSVVYGLFGLGLFVLYMKLGTSILAGSLTLAIMNLPVIISTTEEALRSVPQAFRVVSISLGATRWQTIQRIILRQALPGMITGVILGLERAAGETAPILFTAAAWLCLTICMSSQLRSLVCPRRSNMARRWYYWCWCWE
jgi:phosphate transport system permease protein